MIACVEIIIGTKKCVIFNVYIVVIMNLLILKSLVLSRQLQMNWTILAMLFIGDWNTNLWDIDNSMFAGHVKFLFAE